MKEIPEVKGICIAFKHGPHCNSFLHATSASNRQRDKIEWNWRETKISRDWTYIQGVSATLYRSPEQRWKARCPFGSVASALWRSRAPAATQTETLKRFDVWLSVSLQSTTSSSEGAERIDGQYSDVNRSYASSATRPCGHHCDFCLALKLARVNALLFERSNFGEGWQFSAKTYS